MLLILAILTGIRWDLRVVLICISLMAKDTEYSLSVSRLFEISLLRILCLDLYPIFSWNIWFVDVYFLEFFIFFGDQPFLDMGLAKNFSHSVGFHFVLLTVSFVLQKLCSFIKSNLLIVIFGVCAIGILFKKLSPVLIHSKFSLFSSSVYLVLYVEVFDPFGLEFCAG